MIQLPDGFDIVALMNDFYNFSVPFVSISFLIGVGVLILNILGRER